MYLEEYNQIVNVALSAQELIDCVGKEHNVKNGCEGMPLVWGFDYAFENGIAYRQFYPHTNVYGNCMVIESSHKYHIAGYEKPEVYNKLGLFELLKKGPVAVTLGLDPEYFQFYQNDDSIGPYFDTAFWRPSVYGVLLEYNQYKEEGKESFSDWPFFAIETRLRACDSMTFRLPIRESTIDGNIAGIAGFAIRPIVTDYVPDIIIVPTSVPTSVPTTVLPSFPTTLPPTTLPPTIPVTTLPPTEPTTAEPTTTEPPIIPTEPIVTIPPTIPAEPTTNEPPTIPITTEPPTEPTTTEPPTIPVTTQPPTIPTEPIITIPPTVPTEPTIIPTEPPTTEYPTIEPTPTPTPEICPRNELIIATEEDCSKIFETSWTSIYVKSGLCNSFTSDLVLSDYPCLQTIYFEKYSFIYVPSITFSNMPQLLKIETGDGDTTSKGALYNVQSISFSSIIYLFYSFTRSSSTSFYSYW